MSDPFPHPTRTERRGQFPVHGNQHATRPLTRQEALDLARRHLADWVADRDHAADLGDDDWPQGKLYQ